MKQSNLKYLLTRIKLAIPREILNKAFIPPFEPNVLTPSIDSEITSTIIRGRLWIECSQIAGEEMVIPVNTIPYEYRTDGLLLRVGYQVTNGREISEVLSINYGVNNYRPVDTTIISAVNNGVFNTDARIELIGDNCVFIHGYQIPQMFWAIRVVVKDDPEFENLSIRLMPFLAKAAILATKSYIHNTLSVYLGSEGQTVRGVDYGKIISVIDAYESAEEEFMLLLEADWKAMRLMANKFAYARYLKLLIR
jgi:hypothetical protein